MQKRKIYIINIFAKYVDQIFIKNIMKQMIMINILIAMNQKILIVHFIFILI